MPSWFPNFVNFISKDKACDAMEIFDELIESEVSIVTPHLKTLVEFSLQVCNKIHVIVVDGCTYSAP